MDAATTNMLLALAGFVLFLVAVVGVQKLLKVPARKVECPAQENYFFLCPHGGIHQ